MRVSGSSLGLSDKGSWEPEDIPDSDQIFARVHLNDIEQDGKPMLRAFRNRDNPFDPTAPKAMSTDWCKYSTADQARARAVNSPRHEIGVVALVVGQVRALYGQGVIHTPWFRKPEVDEAPNNRAHTDVVGPKSKKDARTPEERVQILGVRSGLVEMSVWVVRPSDP